MMLLHTLITHDVIVRVRVLPRSEVPRFLLGEVRLVLETLQLVIKVDYIEGLLVPQGSILYKCYCYLCIDTLFEAMTLTRFCCSTRRV